MFKRMSLAIGAAALTLCLAGGAGVYAQDQPSPGTSPSISPAPRTPGDQGGAAGRRGRGRRSRDMPGGDMAPGERMRGGGDMSSDRSMRSTTSAPVISAMPAPVDWSAPYRLTPAEHKRLRAMGLTDDEVFALANIAEVSHRHIDDVADVDPLPHRVLRGETFEQIAASLNVPFDEVTRRKPEWQSAEWEQAVRSGSWYAHPAGMSGMGSESSGRGTRR